MKTYVYTGPNLMKHYRPALEDYDIIGRGMKGEITGYLDKGLAKFTEPGGLATWYVPLIYLTEVK